MTNTRGKLAANAESARAKNAARPLRILVADDDRDTVTTLMVVLRHEGHEVKGVYRGADVVKAMGELNPHAVILDINMPVESGYEIARRILAKHGPRPLIIGISGVYKKMSDILMAKALGFDHYLTKPYDTGDMLRFLEPLQLPEGPA